MKISYICVVSFSLILFAPGTTLLRVIRSSTNSSKFIYRGIEPETTTGVPDFCIPEPGDTVNLTAKREKRSAFFNVSLPDPQIALKPDTTSKLSEHFLQCQHVVIEPGCYFKLPNRSVRVPLYDRIFDEKNYLITDEELFICSEFFDDFIDDSKFSRILDIFSVVGVAISTVCIILHIAMFLYLKNLRNLPGYCLFSLCMALLIAYICSFTTFGTPERSGCTAVGMVMFYSFLASFFWMNAMSYDVWRSLRMATSKLRLTTDRPMFSRFALYSGYSWGGPLMIILISLMVNYSNSNYKYNLIFNTNTCWFQYKQALLVYFATPFFILLFFNILLFVHSFLTINNASMHKAENKDDLWPRFLIVMRLAIIMGLTWICGIIALASQITALWYIYSILNTSQGVFIFLSFSFTKKTMKECKRAVLKHKSSMFPTQISTIRGQTSSTQPETTV